MSGIVFALILAAAAGGWVYAQVTRRTGGNKTTSLIAAVAVAVAVLIIALTLLSFLPK